LSPVPGAAASRPSASPDGAGSAKDAGRGGGRFACITHCAARTHSAATSTRALATKNQARVSPTVSDGTSNSGAAPLPPGAPGVWPKTLAMVAASARTMGGAARTTSVSTRGARARRFASAQQAHSLAARPT